MYSAGVTLRVFSVRLIVALILGITLVTVSFSYYEVQVEKQGLRRDLERRVEVLGESLAGNVERYLDRGSTRELQRLVDRFGDREHLAGVAVCDPQGAVLAETPRLKQLLKGTPPVVLNAITGNEERSVFLHLGSMSAHVYAAPLHRDGNVDGGLVLVTDANYIRQESQQVWRESFFRILAQVAVIMLITVLIVRWSITGPIAKAAEWMKALRTGRISGRHRVPDLDLLRPLAREVATMAESLHQARSAAETEARLRVAGESLWTPERLSVEVRTRLRNSRLFVVSNREPYSHVRQGRAIGVMVPASGLVTALEPVLRASQGTWIAHGSGDADRETVDQNDRLRVPPQDPCYTLRRVWLGKEEEEGYYYGFSNEGLWPLCHIAHTRPIFRASDWEYYQAVNRKFADAVCEEMSRLEHPVVLVQDYHFALLPQMIKQHRPDARVAIFWHIPWPNPEAFDICPWQHELLDGLLGADLIGFHLQAHCSNFLQTVDRSLESRIDWEHSSIGRRDHLTTVRPFPISVAPNETAPAAAADFTSPDRAALLKELGVQSIFLGVGVDRVDYTKGILERFLAIERFLEKYPVYQGQFTFVQVGAPSRTHIKRYHDLLNSVEEESERINWRVHNGKWKPILFVKENASHEHIERLYRAADLCLVSSLHDGMNLVAKEFVASRQDERGVLILSRFTGAARELRDALLINPYDIDQTAEAIRYALEMEPEERTVRMRRMRRMVQEHNIYRWAGNLIAELCEVRIEPSAVPEPGEARSLPA